MILINAIFWFTEPDKSSVEKGEIMSVRRSRCLIGLHTVYVTKFTTRVRQVMYFPCFRNSVVTEDAIGCIVSLTFGALTSELLLYIFVVYLRILSLIDVRKWYLMIFYYNVIYLLCYNAESVKFSEEEVKILQYFVQHVIMEFGL